MTPFQLPIPLILQLCFLCVFTIGCAPKPPITDRPNIILIYADDLGIGETEPYGQEKIRTPHLSKMAAEGMRFLQHYSGAPVCAPARAILLTGKHAGQSAIRGNYGLGGFADSTEAGQMPLPAGTFTMAHLLQRAGYATAAIGKWGLGMHDNEGSPNNQGFDYFFGYLDQKQAHNYYPTHLWENASRFPLNNPERNVHQHVDTMQAASLKFDSFKGEDYAPEFMTEKALAFIDGHRSEPFFLYLPYTLPHLSLQIPDQYVEQYIKEFDDQPYDGQDGYVPHRYPRAAYAAMITYLDSQVGRIITHIKSLGLDDNTLILFTSDNGAAFNGGVDYRYFNSVGTYRGHKMDVFEGGIKIPLIARWPGQITPGKVSDHLSAQYDVLVTFAELVGQTVDDTNGISFLPTLLGKGKQARHDFLYFEYPEKGGQLAVRLQRWKGVKLDLRKNPQAHWQLYDLQNDPREQHDVAAENPEILKRLDSVVRQEHQPASVENWNFIKTAP